MSPHQHHQHYQAAMELTLSQKRAAAGAIGGKARSEKKTAAVRRNASLPRPKARISRALRRAKNN